MKFSVNVEPDDVEKGCFMVVFRNPEKNNEIIGIPLRGVSKKEASDAKDPLTYAFEFGLKAMREQVEQTLWRMHPSII